MMTATATNYIILIMMHDINIKKEQEIEEKGIKQEDEIVVDQVLVHY